MFQRLFKPPAKRSFFLFGCRGVGKTTLLKKLLPPEKTFAIDLLDYELELKFHQNPGELRKIIEALPRSIEWIVIDEVQKIPPLLNEVHRQIELDKKRHFALTGSSARKLKRGQANLLAGRAFTYTLFPLTHLEMGRDFDLNEALRFGTLPAVSELREDEKRDYLKTYTHTYLKEEIQAEGLVRRLPEFHRFLPLAASQDGQELSYSNLAEDVGVDYKTIQTYFEILEDTLVGTLLPGYHKSLRKRQKKHPKFYFFDTGVARALAGNITLPVRPGSREYGRLFENFFINEIIRLNSYFKTDYRFSYFATDTLEIDLVIERPGKGTLFVEMKSGDVVKEKTLTTFHKLMEETPRSSGIVLYQGKTRLKDRSLLILPWQEALAHIFEGHL